MVLHVDTKNPKIVLVFLKKEGKIVESLSEENEYGSQVLLPLIMKLLRTSNPGSSTQIQSRIGFGGFGSWKELDGVEVDTGPGSYTGLKVGVSVAQALGFALNIPVNGKLNITVKLDYT